MKVTAKEMHNSPAKVYRQADKGDVVIINHDRYPDKVFELKARERGLDIPDDAKNKVS